MSYSRLRNLLPAHAHDSERHLRQIHCSASSVERVSRLISCQSGSFSSDLLCSVLRSPRRFHRPLLGHPMGSAGPDFIVLWLSHFGSLRLSPPGPAFVRGHHAFWSSNFQESAQVLNARLSASTARASTLPGLDASLCQPTCSIVINRR